MKFDILGAFAQESDDLRQRTRSEARREQRFDEKHAGQPVRIQHLNLIRQTVVTSGSGAVDVAPKGVRKTLVEVLPTIAPDFDVHREKDIQHLVEPSSY